MNSYIFIGCTAFWFLGISTLVSAGVQTGKHFVHDGHGAILFHSDMATPLLDS